MTAVSNAHVAHASPAGLPSDAETRGIVEQARRLRAETLAGMARGLLARIARRPAGAGAGLPGTVGGTVGGMPHARA